jgi:hypothetical protein
MKQSILVGLAAAVAPLCACNRAESGATNSKGTPKAQISATVQQLGVVTTDIAEAVFQVKNVGTADLHVSGGPCGYSVTPKSPIPPGKEAQIRLPWEVKGKSGRVSRTFPLVTNDKTQPVINLTLGARVEHPARLEPSTLNLGTIEPGESVVRRLALVGPIASQLELGAIDAANHTKVTARKLNGEVELEIAIVADAPRGHRITGAVDITPVGANVPAGFMLSVQVEGVVRPTFVVEPMELTAHAAPDGSIALPDLSVTHKGEFTVLSIVDSQNLVTAQAHPDGTGKVRITSTVKTPLPGQLIQGMLTIVTDPPAVPELTHRYTLYAAPKRK